MRNDRAEPPVPSTSSDVIGVIAILATAAVFFAIATGL